MSTVAVLPTYQRNLRFAEVFNRIAAGRSDRMLSRLSGISHTYIGDWKWGRPPSYRKLAEFVENLTAGGEQLSPADVEELFVSAGYVPRSASAYAEAPPERLVISEVPIGQYESPRQWAHARIGELVTKYGALGYALPSGRALFSGFTADMDEGKARDAVAAWLEALQADNPGRDVDEPEVADSGY